MFNLTNFIIINSYEKRVLVLFMAFLVYSQEEFHYHIAKLNPEELKDQIEINQQSKEGNRR